MNQTLFWPGTKIIKSNANAFTYWKDGASSLVDRSMRGSFGGLTQSQAMTAQVERIRAETGVCPGSISGMSVAGDEQIERGAANRRASLARLKKAAK